MKAIVRVTLANGCYHEDVGIGSSTLPDPVEAVKVASKGCVSDSIKRTLQHFGPALGSCLRDKEWVSTDLMNSRATGKTPKRADENESNKRIKAHQRVNPPTSAASSKGAPQYFNQANLVSNSTISTASAVEVAAVSTFIAPPIANAEGQRRAQVFPSVPQNMNPSAPKFVAGASSIPADPPPPETVGLQSLISEAEDMARAYEVTMMAREYEETMKAYSESASVGL